MIKVIAILVLLIIAAFSALFLIDLRSKNIQKTASSRFSDSQIEEIKNQLFPKNGHNSQIKLRDSVIRLVEAGVIDKTKFLALYSDDKKAVVEKLLDFPSSELIVLNQENASLYLNLLWPLGLANHLEINKKSAINQNVRDYASTAGWTIGQKEGYQYFNQQQIIPLNQEQEALVLKVSQNIYRPCCDNHTFFQDCNHGSALLGLLELGAGQGLSESELYQEALTFNTYWFPSHYLQTATYFQILKNQSWTNLPAKLILSKQYSSFSGWKKNVQKPLERAGFKLKDSTNSTC